MVRNYPIKSKNVLAHVRKANRGRVALENTHPFSRELWGRAWSFVHNGQLRGVKKLGLKHFKPIGKTDSEHAFCWILDELRESFPKRPSPKTLKSKIAQLMASLRELGVFNALLSDGDFIFASCSKKLCYIKRQAPFGKASLIDEDMQVDFAKETTPNDKVIIIATEPLTRDEEWTILKPQSYIAFSQGEVV